MVEALCKSTMSILSSGLTTVIGFLALCLMQFQIGPDMGLVLGKGVAISLLTVFLFSPSLILLCYNLLDKTRHRSFVPSFRRLGKCGTRLMIPVMTVLLILIVPAYLGSGKNSYYYGSSHIFGANTQLGADIEAIEDVFGKSDTYVLMVPRGNAAREKELSVALKELPSPMWTTPAASSRRNMWRKIPCQSWCPTITAGWCFPSKRIWRETRLFVWWDGYGRLLRNITPASGCWQGRASAPAT